MGSSATGLLSIDPRKAMVAINNRPKHTLSTIFNINKETQKEKEEDKTRRKTRQEDKTRQRKQEGAVV
jgi:hypothetical protein